MWGITAVHVGDTFSTVGDTFSTVEVVQYSGGKHQHRVGWLQYCGGYFIHWEDTFSACRDNISTVRDNISIVEGIMYSGGRFLILACLAIKNDEKISIFLYYETKFLFRSFENSNRFHAFLELDLFRNN